MRRQRLKNSLLSQNRIPAVLLCEPDKPWCNKILFIFQETGVKNVHSQQQLEWITLKITKKNVQWKKRFTICTKATSTKKQNTEKADQAHCVFEFLSSNMETKNIFFKFEIQRSICYEQHMTTHAYIELIATVEWAWFGLQTVNSLHFCFVSFFFSGSTTS